LTISIVGTSYLATGKNFTETVEKKTSQQTRNHLVLQKYHPPSDSEVHNDLERVLGERGDASSSELAEGHRATKGDSEKLALLPKWHQNVHAVAKGFAF
jgi:hypothetical protein